MNEKLVQAQDVFLGKVNQLCSRFGLNNIMAQLYALLYLSSKPLSLDEMAERLKISKGSVSINMRALEGYGAVRKIWVKGSRKDYYETEMDIARVVLDRLKLIARARLVEVDDMINSSYEIINPAASENGEDKEAVKVLRQRLQNLKTLYSKAKNLFNMFDSGLLNGVLTKKSRNTSRHSVEI